MVVAVGVDVVRALPQEGGADGEVVDNQGVHGEGRREGEVAGLPEVGAGERVKPLRTSTEGKRLQVKGTGATPPQMAEPD